MSDTPCGAQQAGCGRRWVSVLADELQIDVFIQFTPYSAHQLSQAIHQTKCAALSRGDIGGDVESVFMRDELLTNVSIYWLAGCITSSTRLYYEAMHSGEVRRISAKYCKARNPSGMAEGWGFLACMPIQLALFL